MGINAAELKGKIGGGSLLGATPGIKGAKGDKGDKGEQGIQGIQGPKGDKGDTGAGLNILGSYNSYAELIAAHPTGETGDAYLVDGYLYVWTDTQWSNVGNIEGPQGPKGDTGPKGEKGDTGPKGDKGDPGEDAPVYTAGTGIEITTDNTINCTASGAPNGGTAGQVLMKKSNADNDTKWASLSKVAGTGNYNDLNGKPSVMNSETTSNTDTYSCTYVNDGLSSKANSTHTHTTTDITNLTELIVGDTLPIGVIVPYSAYNQPKNWLPCDGSEISRVQYQDLFKIIGTKYGEGDGSTTFNLPNLNGRTVVGYDTNDTDFDVIGKTGGEKTHTLTVDEMPYHRHEDIMVSTSHLSGWNTEQGSTGIFQLERIFSGSGTAGENYFRTSYTGSSQPHNNLQPYMVERYIIKAYQAPPITSQVLNSGSSSKTDTYSCFYVNDNFTTRIHDLINSLFPVGKVEIFYDNDDHSNHLGLAWERTMIGRMPLGINANDTDFNVIGQTGGEKTHTLTVDEIPSHQHKDITVNYHHLAAWNTGQGSTKVLDIQNTLNVNGTAEENYFETGYTGSNAAHNNMPPYEIVAFWKRIE